jgi:hypothetical protein
LFNVFDSRYEEEQEEENREHHFQAAVKALTKSQTEKHRRNIMSGCDEIIAQANQSQTHRTKTTF